MAPCRDSAEMSTFVSRRAGYGFSEFSKRVHRTRLYPGRWKLISDANRRAETRDIRRRPGADFHGARETEIALAALSRSFENKLGDLVGMRDQRKMA
jgi:hypothetical protein